MEKLNRNNLLGLMNQMRSKVPPEPAPPECKEIDWTVPHHYGADEMDVLGPFTKKLAGFVQRTLQHYCDDNFETKVSQIGEHFASFLVNEINQNQKDHYFLPLKTAGQGHVGFIGLSFESCTKLIAQMLRDPEAEIGAQGEISTLEESILQDIAMTLAESMIDGCTEYNITSLETTDQLIRGEWPVRFRDLEDMIQITFEAECPTAKIEMSLYLLEDIFAPLIGTKVINTSDEIMKEVPGRIVGRMQEAPMEVSARLCSAMITLNDVVSIQKGDVIVLDRKVNAPVDVLVNGQMCFKAWPAQHVGRSAIVVAESN